MNKSDTEQKPRLALLIDADNISARYLNIILNEIPRYGIATYRRIYGDFTDPQMAHWRQTLLDNSIIPIQQFSNVKNHKRGEKAGKNATDSTLIIDAMDILYAGKVDGFIIVSSDSDFTRLAGRLRESNMLVIGMGRNQTAISFRHACTKFVNIEYLYKLEQGKQEHSRPDRAHTDDVETTTTLDDVKSVVAGVIHDDEAKGREWTSLAVIGSSLNNKFPDFDVRNFGYSQLSKLIEELGRFELSKVENGYNVRIKQTSASSAEIFKFMIDELSFRQDKTMGIAPLASKVYKRFPNFNIKDSGYSQFYKFADSSPDIQIVGDSSRKQAKLVSSTSRAIKARRKVSINKPSAISSAQSKAKASRQNNEHTQVKKKVSNGEVLNYMVGEVSKRKDKSMGIAPLAAKVRKTFPDFNLESTGYDQFFQFANDCKDLTVVGEGHRRKATLVKHS